MYKGHCATAFAGAYKWIFYQVIILLRKADTTDRQRLGRTFLERALVEAVGFRRFTPLILLWFSQTFNLALYINFHVIERRYHMR